MDLGSPSHLPRGEPAAAVGLGHGSCCGDISGGGITPMSLHCSVPQSRAGCGCHTA